MLRVCNLSQTLGNKTIIHNISVTFELGKITALLGPNGAGKTTLLRTIIGLASNPTPLPNENSIEWDGQLINQQPPHQRVAQGIAYLPQTSALFGELTVHDNLWLVFECHQFWRQRTKEEFNQQLNYWLEQTDLIKTTKQAAGSLSGGQKRKLEVIRSILMHPRLLICDEPFAGVDPKSIYELKKIFSMLSSQGMGIVISDHHVDQLLSIAHYVYVILQGAVIAAGTPQEVLNDTQTREHYLGAQFHKEMSEKFLD